MNRRAHLTIGILVFTAYSFFIVSLNKTIISILFFALIASVIGSLLPDMIERPGDWRHRGFLHSKRALKWTVLIFGITTVVALLVPYFYVASSLFLGYAIHLGLDATTKIGLPA